MNNGNIKDRSRPFSVYVAASAGGDSYPRVTAAIAALRAAGVHVTCTWPEVVAATPGGANPRDASAVQRRGWSTTDLNEIDAADAVWFLVPDLPATTRGAWFESGYAYSSHKHLVFSGDTKQSVFCALGHEFQTDSAAIAHIVGLRDQLAELHRINNEFDDEAITGERNKGSLDHLFDRDSLFDGPEEP